MKNIIISYVSIFILNINVSAQNDQGKMNDMGRISLSPILSDQVANIAEDAKQLLNTKLQQLVTQNGMGGGFIRPRFIITATINVLSKDIIPGPPQMMAQEVTVVFFIADYIDQKVFASTSIQVKGVGTNETKAFISALKQINPKSTQMVQFVELGKTKIIEYYNSQCDFILTKAQSLSAQNKYEEAIYHLTAIPEVCKDCYNKAMAAIKPIYQEYINYLCDQNLARANAAWVKSLDYLSANEAGKFLELIYPNAKCYKEAQSLIREIKAKTKDLWKFELKKYDDQIKLEQQLIKAYRDVGVAYGTNQQPRTYNTYFLGR